MMVCCEEWSTGDSVPCSALAAPSAAPLGVALSPLYSALLVTWQVCAWGGAEGGAEGGQGWGRGGSVVTVPSSSTQPPPVRDRNGVITGYNLYYRVTPAGVGVSSQAYTKLLVAPGGRHQVDGLLGDTPYDVIMQAVTAAGAGPNSTVVMTTALSE